MKSDNEKKVKKLKRKRKQVTDRGGMKLESDEKLKEDWRGRSENRKKGEGEISSKEGRSNKLLSK